MYAVTFKDTYISTQLSEKRELGAHAANKSGLSRYCKYSKFGIGSRSGADNESRQLD